jgi:hypothetical protein
VIVKVADETARESLTDRVCAGLLESETVAVTLVVPLAVGVPVIAPLVPKLSPAGRTFTDHL